MNEVGFLYILINPSLAGLVKIGKTYRDPELRARELSQATGVATPFYLAYSLPFSDADAAERYLHSLLELHGFRLTVNREFFQIPLQTAIEFMMDVQRRFAAPSEQDTGSTGSASADADLSDIDFSDFSRHPGYDIYEQALAHQWGLEDTIQDMNEALRLLDHARKLDFPAAYTSLAEYYSECSDPIDIPRAMEYLKEGAQRGHGRCYIEMASLFRNCAHMENFQKCWKKYFTGQTFLRDDARKWTQNLISDESALHVGMSRISYIQLYLSITADDNVIVPPDILTILAPFRDELIQNITSSIDFCIQQPSESALMVADDLRALLEYVERLL